MINDVKKEAEQRMQRGIEAFKEDLRKLRTGRAHAGLLEQVVVEYYGTNVPVKQTANISVEDARTLEHALLPAHALLQQPAARNQGYAGHQRGRHDGTLELHHPSGRSLLCGAPWVAENAAADLINPRPAKGFGHPSSGAKNGPGARCPMWCGGKELGNRGARACPSAALRAGLRAR